MSAPATTLISGFFLVFALGSVGYLCAALYQTRAFLRRLSESGGEFPPVTVLKPVCGLEEGLEENLRSFCRQNYPEFQLIFGLQDPDDPAIPLIRRVMAEFPGLDLDLIVDGRLAGPNRKAANLANMISRARSDLLVVADSDIRVDENYLAAIIAPLADPSVGAVTSPYGAAPAGGLPSRLGALHINDGFFPSVLVATALKESDFCLGASIAIRRRALEEAGGFETLAAYLADDYELGQRVRRAGWRVVLSRYMVHNVVAEPSLKDLFLHELRWARTIRACRPAGFASTVLCNNPLLLTALFMTSSGFSTTAQILFAFACILRWRLHLVARKSFRFPPPTSLRLIPLRELLSLAVWTAAFCGQRVSWRNRQMFLSGDGKLKETPRPAPSGESR